jgi:hypothetical protein
VGSLARHPRSDHSPQVRVGMATTAMDRNGRLMCAPPEWGDHACGASGRLPICVHNDSLDRTRERLSVSDPTMQCAGTVRHAPRSVGCHSHRSLSICSPSWAAR